MISFGEGGGGFCLFDENMLVALERIVIHKVVANSRLSMPTIESKKLNVDINGILGQKTTQKSSFEKRYREKHR